MKKVLAILFAVSLCISSLYTVAFAEEEMSNEMIPVCVSVPEGWDAPCCWAWADDGTSLWMMGGITLMFHTLCRTSLSMPVRPLSRRKALR